MAESAGGSERRGFRVLGRVQGVGFRWWTRRAAQDLGLGGYVQNLGDGTVEVHAVGDTRALDRFETLLQQGPPAARVELLERVPADPKARGDEFEIGMH